MTTIINGAVNHGIALRHGNYSDTLSISSSGAVSGTLYGVYGTGSYLNNAGNIQASTIGVELSGSAISSGHIYGKFIGVGGIDLSLQNSGVITAATIGVEIDVGTLANAGLISASSSFGAFIEGGVLFNGGTITGQEAGVILPYGQAYNSGTISGNGVGLEASGTTSAGITVTNNPGGLISGGTFGAAVIAASGANATLTNRGIINGVMAGVVVENTVFSNYGGVGGFTFGVALYNDTAINGGTIRGGQAGLYVRSGVVDNNGYISGGSYAIKATEGLELVLGPSSSMHGMVLDEAGTGLLYLSGSGGTVGGTDNAILGFSNIVFEGSWTLEDSVEALAHTQISRFAQGSTIVLDDFAATSSTYVAGTGLELSNGSATEILSFAGYNFTGQQFVATDLSTETVITLEDAPVNVACFCPGTRIHTARGKIAVESLKIGDLVQTAAHGMQPIRWIGRRAYDGRFIADNHLALPVKIRRHALGLNVPARDLFVSPGHAICEAGVLVHAWRLINNVSITQAKSVEQVEYFHIELDRHAVIFAENTPVESFLDIDCRAQFHATLGTPAAEKAKPCLPLIEEGYHLARLKSRIDARAGLTASSAPGPMRGNFDHAGILLCGWAQDEAAPEQPVEMELLCAGQIIGRFLANKYRPDLRAAGLGSGCHAFEIPAPTTRGVLTIRRAADGAVLGTAWAKAA